MGVFFLYIYYAKKCLKQHDLFFIVIYIFSLVRPITRKDATRSRFAGFLFPAISLLRHTSILDRIKSNVGRFSRLYVKSFICTFAESYIFSFTRMKYNLARNYLIKIIRKINLNKYFFYINSLKKSVGNKRVYLLIKIKHWDLI